MPLDIARVIADNTPTSNALYAENVNPRFAKALKIIGFDRNYVKASGAYMYDDKGRKYLDMLAGYGAFNMGRNHPAIRQVLKDFMDADYCSLVQMETPVLCGVVAAELKKRAGYDLSKVYFCSTGQRATRPPSSLFAAPRGATASSSLRLHSTASPPAPLR
jgi:ornithine--oxo-acid transaminase